MASNGAWDPLKLIDDAEAAAQEVIKQRTDAAQTATDRVSRMRDALLNSSSEAVSANNPAGTFTPYGAGAGGSGDPGGQSGVRGQGGGPYTWGPSNSSMQFLLQHESGNRTTAKNPKSTAFGLGQLLDYNRASYAKKLGIADPNTTDYTDQLRMMEQYIKERYGTPEKAEQFWRAHNWY